MTAKTRAIPSSPPGQIPAKVPGSATGWLRQVTFTPSTAGPLAVIHLTTETICRIIQANSQMIENILNENL